jgi:hypothetical protein
LDSGINATGEDMRVGERIRKDDQLVLILISQYCIFTQNQAYFNIEFTNINGIRLIISINVIINDVK